MLTEHQMLLCSTHTPLQTTPEHFKETQNHRRVRLEGTTVGHLVPPPCSGRVSLKHTAQDIYLLLLHPPVYFFSLFISFLLLPAESTLDIWRGRKHLYSPSPHTDFPLIFQILTCFFHLQKIRPGKPCVFHPEQAQGVTNQNGTKTVRLMFLWKS